MALVLNDRVKETTTTTGTGTINLAGAETGFESFVSAIGNSNTTYYAIAHQSANEFEIGIGTVTDASPDTLSRTTIISSTNSDAAVDFSAGTKDVFCTLPASKAVFFDDSSGSSDVAIGSRGTNPMGLSMVGTVLALTEQTNVASFQMDGAQASRIDMGSGPGTRQFVIYTDTSNYSSLERKDAKPILFATDNTERLRIDASGNVGIGASSPSMKLNISHADQDGLRFNCANTAETFIDFGDTDDNDVGQISYDHADNHMAFNTNAAERIRIDSSGNIGVGTTSPDRLFHVKRTDSGGTVAKFENSAGTVYIELNTNNQASGDSGYISYDSSMNLGLWTDDTQRANIDSSGNMIVTGNVTAYGSVSDERLKDNIEVIDNAIDKVKELKGVTFNYKKDGKKSTGLIAQDLEKVLPEAVYTAKDLEDEEHLAIRYGNTVGLLVEAIKEQQEQIETLTARVKELEDK